MVLLRMASACTGPTLEIGEFSEETEGEITEKEAWGRLFPVGRVFMAFGEYDIYLVCIHGNHVCDFCVLKQQGVILSQPLSIPRSYTGHITIQVCIKVIQYKFVFYNESLHVVDYKISSIISCHREHNTLYSTTTTTTNNNNNVSPMHACSDNLMLDSIIGLIIVTLSLLAFISLVWLLWLAQDQQLAQQQQCQL